MEVAENLETSFCLDSMELHANLKPELPSSSPLPDHGDVASDLPIEISEITELFGVTDCSSVMTCDLHSNQLISSYCDLCCLLICDVCVETVHAEHKNMVGSLQPVAENCRKELTNQANNLRKQQKLLEKWILNVNETYRELCSSKDQALKEANEAFKLIEDQIHRQKIETLREIESKFSAKEAVLHRQKSELESSIKNMSLGHEFVTKSLKSSIDNNLSFEVHPYVDQNRNDFKQDITSNTELSNFLRTYFLHKHMSSRLKNLSTYGQVTTPKSTNLITSTRHIHVDSSEEYLNHDIPKNDYLIANYSMPRENSFLVWTKSENFQKFLSSVSSSQIGKVVTDHSVAHKSILSGECLLHDVTHTVGCEVFFVLTAKNHVGELEKSGNVEIEITASFYDGNEEETVKLNNAKSRDKELATKRRSFGISNSQRRSPVTPTRKFNRSKSESDSFVGEVCQVIPCSCGSYEIIFTPTRAGKYRINVKIHGEDVINSPVSINTSLPVKSPTRRSLPGNSPRSSISIRSNQVKQRGLKRLQNTEPIHFTIEDDLVLRVGSRGRNKGEFLNPQDVAVDDSNRLFVTDSNTQCIQIFQMKLEEEAKAKCTERFGEKGRQVGQVYRPMGVLLLPSGDIAVSDYDNKVVNLFSADGKYKTKIGAGKLNGPRGICLNHNGHLVVVDNKQCQIFIFQLNGKLVTKFGNKGTEKDQLAGPHYVTINNNNELLITDFYNHCVKVFSNTGKFLRTFGSYGEGCGQFNAPTGICVDKLGHVIVADWGNSRLQIFDQKDSFLSYVNTKQQPLYGPQGVSVTSQGHVAVADSGHHCVKIYKILQ